MSNKYLMALTNMTAFMRTRTLERKRYHISAVAKESGNTEAVTEAFLAEMLKSDYRDEQLEIFCSMIVSTCWPKESNSATQKVNFTLMAPPVKIMAALAHMEESQVLTMLDSKEGRESMELYIERYWVTARDGWLAKLDSDFEKSGLGPRLDTLFPGRPPVEQAIVEHYMNLLSDCPDITAEEVREFLEKRGIKAKHT